MTDVEFYNIGDYVMVNNQSQQKTECGRIEDILIQNNTFSYIVFYKPEDTHSGIQPHHGKNEIIKSTVNREESINNITSKIEVMKLPDYGKLSKDEKALNNRFVCRQNYDPVEQKFNPDLEPDCFCLQVINPDEDLVVCQCERIFHYKCIPSDTANEQAACPTCGNSILSTAEAIYKRRRLENDQSVLLKSNKDEEFYELFASALDEATTDKQDNHTTNNNHHPIPAVVKNQNDKRPYPTLEMKKHPSNPLIPKGLAKKPSRKEMNNIDNEAFERIKTEIDNFSKAHQNKNMTEIERSRYFIKEKYYKSLLYGIEEVKEKQKLSGGSTLNLSDGERGILARDEKENIKKAQDLALSIEATIWHSMNRNKSAIDPNYNMKNRELLNYLMDDNNYELRLSLLIGERKPEFLCKASGKELVPKDISEKIEIKEMKTLKQSLLQDQVKIVAKSHKGETVIEAQAPEPMPVEPVKEPEHLEDQTETLTELVKKIERGDMQIEDGKAESYDVLSINNESEFDEFKLSKKKSEAKKSNNGDSPGYTPEDYELQRKKSVGKNYEDTLLQISNLGNNKLIDQEVLKKAVNFFSNKIFNDISERLSNHLKPEIANSILDEVKKKNKIE